jgi:cyclopropane fatty-acyl-phospholipid synthase-like methyltransferase
VRELDPRLRRLAHVHLTFNAPLSEDRAARLVERLSLAPGRHVVDLGCGWAELLLRIVGAHRAATGTGVDRDRVALDRGRLEAARRGLHERVDLVEADLPTFEDHGDLVLCVGAAHAFGGAAAALRRIRGLVTSGGHVLFADEFWERPPGNVARSTHGDLPVFDGLQSLARAAGFVVEQAERSTVEEWDAFEAAWRSGLETAGETESASLADEHERAYRETRRGVLGFAWLTLRPAG